MAAGVNAMILQDNPARVTVFLLGEYATDFEKISDTERACREAEVVIEAVLGRKGKVTRATCGRWGSNPYIRGAYSYPRVGASKNRAQVLSKPVCTSDGALRIAMAGEYTHPSYYSTLHGAIESGAREAGRCISFLKGQSE